MGQTGRRPENETERRERGRERNTGCHVGEPEFLSVSCIFLSLMTLSWSPLRREFSCFSKTRKYPSEQVCMHVNVTWRGEYLS